ncbi:MAG: flavin reductase family protein [Clostridia bacterium]|nr:flavin reductase family protein [Clostridia bacterium]
MIYEKIGAPLCTRLNDRFALLGAVKNDGSYNFMTVSWGGFGILWGKEVCFVFVRPERHTFSFCESSNTFTLSFFDDERRSDLLTCGKKSGRDIDKAKECGFDVSCESGALKFKDAALTLTLRKMYAQDLSEECFFDKSALSFYKDSGYHRMYVCELICADIK